MTDITFVEKLGDLFKNKRVLIIGDSIMRGVYKDICCVLNNNSRLLHDYELVFNRHNVRANVLFNEQIDSFYIDRTNSTLNKEKRIFKSEQFNYYVCFIFNSRVWNSNMNSLLSSDEHYDFIILQSFIWDITRYNHNDGSIYLDNLEKCLSKLQKLNKSIVWILLPPSESIKAVHVNNILSELGPVISQKVQQHSINLLNLADSMKNNIQSRHKDGIHFTPSGHRHITQQIAELLINLQLKTSNTSANESTSLVNTSTKETIPSANAIQRANSNRFNSYIHRRKFHNIKRLGLNNIISRENMKLNINEAEKFGRAFGTAWRTYLYIFLIKLLFFFVLQ